ncbi:MAG: TrkH family potassium uptake protein [Alphaproteobacteria bacterium]|nr:MAG: TrkH family potassium uptake protein [Alphaproteobacteria bacterium]
MPATNIGFTLGRILLLFAAFFLLPAVVSAGYGESETVLAFVAGAILTAFAGGLLMFSYRGVGGVPTKREIIVLPLVGWLAGGFFAGVPMALAGAAPSLFEGFFEGLSGLTTTGATIIEDVDGTPRGILFWRALLQWVGGIATLAFAIAIAPALDLGGARLINLALLHGEGGTLTDRLRGVAEPLLPVYVILSLLCAVLYWAAGMPLFDAVCHALSTVSSGGFSTRSESLAAFHAPLVELVAVPFMILAATNFTYHWATLRRRQFLYWRDPEIRLLGALFLIGVIAIVAGGLVQSHLSGGGPGLAHDLRVAVVSAASAASTTGFVASGEVPLTLFGVVALCALLFVGGGMGSTAGGLKAMRLLILMRHAGCELARLAHPSSIARLNYLQRKVAGHSLSGVWVVYFLFLVALALVAVGFAATGQNLETAFYLALTALSNAGPIMGALDPGFSGFHHLGDDALAVYVLAMTAGRIEIITALALLAPAIWRR